MKAGRKEISLSVYLLYLSILSLYVWTCKVVVLIIILIQFLSLYSTIIPPFYLYNSSSVPLYMITGWWQRRKKATHPTPTTPPHYMAMENEK